MLRAALRRWRPSACGVLVLCAMAGVASAQTAVLAQNPDSLASAILGSFATGSPEAFAGLYPFPDGRELVTWAVEHGAARIPGFARVAERHADRAVLVLSGHVRFGNSGDETSAARGFTNVYEASRTGHGGWTASRVVPLDSLGRIISQQLDVTLGPGIGLAVRDTLEVEMHTASGWASRLNHSIRIDTLTVDGRGVEYAVGGGLVWVAAPRGRHSILMTYTVDVAGDSMAESNSGRFEEAYGHVRNQYFWHPFNWFDRSDTHVDITVRAPRDVQVATDLEQREVVTPNGRTVHASTTEPTFALSLFYDRAWRPVVRDAGPFRFHLYVTPEFVPSPDSLVDRFLDVYRVLSSHFGAPPGGSFGVVQSRARDGNGWLFRSNSVMATARGGGGLLSRDRPYPRAWFGHEVAHAWTRPTGSAANFLREGWATYAESLLLRSRYGPDAERAFWETERAIYEARGFDGKASIVDDPQNSGVAYIKGAWVLRILERVMGSDAFERGMRRYMAMPAGRPAGIREFEAALSSETDLDIETILDPWLSSDRIPDVRARVDGDRLELTQTGAVFRLPLEVEIETATGRFVRTVQLSAREQTIELGLPGPVRAVRVDPDHRYLMKRHWGEIAHFELLNADAREVTLSGSLSSAAVPAVRAGDRWTVDIPLSEGLYWWRWTIDGEPSAYRARTVSASRPLDDGR